MGSAICRLFQACSWVAVSMADLLNVGAVEMQKTIGPIRAQVNP